MRKLILLALVVLVCLGLVVVPATAVQGEASPLVGHWEGVDLGDGSRMILNISEGDGSVSVFFKDFGATACGLDDGEILYAGQAKSLGVVEGDVLSTYGRAGEGVGNGGLWCMAKPPFILAGPSTEPTPFVTYDPGTDTLTIFGDTSPFYRVRNN